MKRITTTEKMLAASIVFTMLLLVFRMIYTGTLTYVFYAWNIFLACIPLFLSRKLLKQQKLNSYAYGMIAVWLLFLPNAPYLITDLFHYRERPPMPKWFDLFLVVSATWNGLMLGIISLMQVEQFLAKHFKAIKVRSFVFTSFLLCGYGIYIGRFLRFNSWDVLTNPGELFYASAHRFVFPFSHLRTWSFSLLFAAMLMLIYFTIKALSVTAQKESPTFIDE